MKKAQVWVYPDYKRKLKRMAAESDKTILELTKDLSLEECKKERKRFNLGFP